jgi:hypothetical protein
VVTDPQYCEAGANGGHGEPNIESRLAELSMGRQTNSRLNRRDVEQAYVGYRLGPKRTWGNRRGLSLQGWTIFRLIQTASPKYPGEQ